MIVFELACAAEHRFEAWFASPEDFERQCGTPMLTCPLCGSGEIRRVPAGLHVAKHGRGSRSDAPPAAPVAGRPGPDHVAAFPEAKEILEAVRRIVEGAENVGQRFPEEARRIHYGESPKRAIRGQASREEAEALREEGIEVVNLPVPPGDDLH
ncbi:MAG: DUF1178 family protein [Burkholderiales bacterium]